MALRIPNHDIRHITDIVNEPHGATDGKLTRTLDRANAAQSTATSSTGSSGATSTPADTAPTSFNTSQWQQLQDAITRAFDSIEGGSFTNSQIYNDIVHTLQGEGWKGANLAAVQQALGGWAGDTSQQTDYVKKGHSNTASDISSWWSTAQRNLTGIFSSNAQTAASSAPPSSSTVGTLLGALQGMGAPQISLPDASSANQTPTVVPVTKTSNSGMMIALLLFLVAGGAVYYYYKKHHAA